MVIESMKETIGKSYLLRTLRKGTSQWNFKLVLGLHIKNICTSCMFSQRLLHIPAKWQDTGGQLIFLPKPYPYSFLLRPFSYSEESVSVAQL